MISTKIDDVEKFGNVVKSSKRFMNMLSDAFQKKHYKKELFWNRIEKCNSERGWGLRFKNGQLLFEEGKIEDILYILKDGKLLSELTDNEYNMDLGFKSGS